jgi:guanine deaminase
MIGYRAEILYFSTSPYASSGLRESFHHWEDGLLVVDQGKIVSVGPYHSACRSESPLADIVDYRGKMLLPGFVDCHSHFPQLAIMASYGKKLLNWLEQYTFPEEGKFQDGNYARRIAHLYINELVRHGITTAASYSTIHKAAAESLLQVAEQKTLRLITGKTLMDRHAPAYLLQDAHAAYDESEELIAKWHGKGRLQYAITPRFAPACSEAMLEMAGRLYQKHPDCLIQTHLAENRAEIKWVKKLFADRSSYLDVYDHYGLVGPRTVFGHAIYLSPADLAILEKKGASIAFCPTSNLFLGSGLMRARRSLFEKIKVGFASDVGAGTSFSMFRTIDEAYKVCQLRGYSLSPLHSLYHATLGGAAVLGLDDKVGSLAAGYEADFILIDPKRSPLIASQGEFDEHSIAEKIFALFILGDDRCIVDRFILGQKVVNNFDEGGI